MNSEVVLKVANLSKRIKGHDILKNISFELKKGEILGLLGPNGSGKTTILKSIVGLLSPTEGVIEIMGHSIQKNFEHAIRHIGAIVEYPQMYEYMTGYDNLIHYARMSNSAEDRIEDIIELLDMKDYIDDKVMTYSLGMKQRLGLGQALLHRPDILLLDEPTNGLDPAGIKDIRNLIQKLAAEHEVSVIISSHLLSEIELICHSIVVIKDGRVIDYGSIEDFKGQTQKESVYFFKVLEQEKARQFLQSVDRKRIEQLAITYYPTGFSATASERGAAELNKAMVQAGLSVVGIERMNQSLEEAFFKKIERV